MVKIRQATVEDVPEIARVHVDTWRTTYKGIVPDAFLAALSYERRAAMWTSAVTRPQPRSHLLVATLPDGAVVGFSSGGPSRATAYPVDGELYAIYLREALHGTGLGRRLFQASVARLRQDGFGSMLVWALADNPACRFYERAGGSILGEKREDIGGEQLREVAYGWPALPAAGAADA